MDVFIDGDERMVHVANASIIVVVYDYAPFLR